MTSATSSHFNFARCLIAFSIVSIISACSSDHKCRSEKSMEGEVSLNKYLVTLPPYEEVIVVPKDRIIFGFDKGATEFDTSWTLLVYEGENSIRCRYTQLLPSSSTGFDGYIDDSMKLLYFDGFQFEISMSKWDSVVNLSGIDKYLAKDSIPYFGCPHCPRYSAYYRSKIIVNSKADNEYLIKLDKLLQNEFIKSLFVKKSNPSIIMQK